MATTEPATESEIEGDFRPYRMTIDTYQRLVDSGVYGDKSSIFLWKGRLVEEGRPTPEGEFPEHRMTVDRFLELIEAGVFGEEDRVFLWHGRLVEEMTKGRRHSFSALKLDRLLDRLLPGEFHVELEQALTLGNENLPEPDLMVLRGTLDDYRDRMPRSVDAALVVEVSDSSVAIDSGAKLRAYAAEGIPAYWIVNIPKRRVEVYGRPTARAEAPGYQDRQEYGPDDEVPVILDGREVGRVAVRDILP